MKLLTLVTISLVLLVHQNPQWFQKKDVFVSSDYHGRTATLFSFKSDGTLYSYSQEDGFRTGIKKAGNWRIKDHKLVLRNKNVLKSYFLDSINGVRCIINEELPDWEFQKESLSDSIIGDPSYQMFSSDSVEIVGDRFYFLEQVIFDIMLRNTNDLDILIELPDVRKNDKFTQKLMNK